jgi:type II secretory pathway predicted ATPase ExeA
MKSWSSVTLTDPSLAWLGGPYGEAFAALRSRAGLLVLTGEIGTGKTTVANALAQSVVDEGGLVGRLFYPRLEPLDFLRVIVQTYGLPTELATREAFHAELRELVRRAATEGRRVVFVVDEAQSLEPELLNEIERLFASVSDDAGPGDAPHQPGVAELGSFSVLLVGQESLESTLAEPAHARLAERITARYRLRPMNENEVAGYIDHRLTVAGVDGVTFTRTAITEIHRASEGLPRLINSIAERAAAHPVQRSLSRWLGPLGLGSLVRVGRVRVAGRVAAIAAREELSDRRPRSDDASSKRRYGPRVVAFAVGGVIVLVLGWTVATHLPRQWDTWRAVWRNPAMPPTPPATEGSQASGHATLQTPATASPEPSRAGAAQVADTRRPEEAAAGRANEAAAGRPEQPVAGVATRPHEAPSASPGLPRQHPLASDVRSPASPRVTRSPESTREGGVARPAVQTVRKRTEPPATETEASGGASGRSTADRESAPDPSAVIDWLLNNKR